MSFSTHWTDGFDYERLGPPAPGCFPAETLVRTQTGAKEIGSIKPGDLVTSFDAKSGQLAERRVLKHITYGARRLYEIRLDNEETLRATGSHSLLTGRGLLPVKRLRFGDCLQTLDGPISIRGVHLTEHCVPVYNLVTECEHTFIVEGCVAHNFTFARKTRMWAYGALSSIRGFRVAEIVGRLGRWLKATALALPLALAAGAASANCGGSSNCADHLRDADRDQPRYETAQPRGTSGSQASGLGEVVGTAVLVTIGCLLIPNCRDAMLGE